MLDNLLNVLRKQLRPPGTTPTFVIAPDRKSGVILVQKGEHLYEPLQLPAPRGVRPQHGYESLHDLTAELLFRAAADLLDPTSTCVACTFSLSNGGSLQAMSADDEVDADFYGAKHPCSESWEAWMGLLGKRHGPAGLMAKVRELPSPMILVIEDGPDNSTIEREVDFAALVYQQLGQLKVNAVYEKTSMAMRNGLLVAELDQKDRKCTAKLPDEFFIVTSILEGGREHKVRVIVTMEIDGSSLYVGLVIAPAQKRRLEAEVARELRDLAQAELGSAWSVRCGTLGAREVIESPVAVMPPGPASVIHHFFTKPPSDPAPAQPAESTPPAPSAA